MNALDYYGEVGTIIIFFSGEIISSFVTFAVKAFTCFIHADVIKEMLKSHAKTRNHEQLHRLREEVNTCVDIIQNMLTFIDAAMTLVKIGLFFKFASKNVEFTGKSIAFLFISTLFAFFLFYTQVFYDKKRRDTASIQNDYIKTAHENRNIIMLYDSKLWCIKKFCDVEEYEPKYFASVEMTNFFCSVLFYTLFVAFNGPGNLTKSIEYKEGYIFVLNWISEIFRALTILPKDLFQEEKLLHEEKQEKLLSLKNYNTQSVMPINGYTYYSSVLNNFNWDRSVYNHKDKLRRHFMNQTFYKLVMEILTKNEVDFSKEEYFTIRKVLRKKTSKMSYGQKKVIGMLRTLLVPAKRYVFHDLYNQIDEKYHGQITKILEDYNTELWDYDYEEKT